jgi:plasmid replication initiation protein
VSPSKRLTTDRYPQGDFFCADIVDAHLKSDIAAMEHPLFALRAGDHRVRLYERGEVTVKVMPGTYGCATVHDQDVWIFAISQMVEGLNRGRDVSRIVRFTAYDFLRTCNRSIGGNGYLRLGEALGRLAGTRIETNIETAGKRERAGFGLLDTWRVIERDQDERMVAVEVTLPDWLYRSVMDLKVLTLSRDYFRLRRPLDRRIYQLVRKHCGSQARWSCKVATLHEKSGSASPLKGFRRLMRELAEVNELPDYRVAFDQERDVVTFFARSAKGSQAQIDQITKMLR